MTRARCVVISQRIDWWGDRGERRDALDQKLIMFIQSAGTVVFPVPNVVATSGNATRSHEPLGQWLSVLDPDGIVLSGGNDIGSAEDRDATEAHLLEYARNRRLPLLGICRGMQMMIVWAGGTLSRVGGHVRRRHRLQAAKDAGIWPTEVNSFHDLGVAQCPDVYSVEAVASHDGSVEAVRHKSLPWEGWMWHPERESPFSAVDQARFKALFSLECKGG